MKKRMRTRDWQYEGDPNFLLPLTFVANLYETLLHEVNQRLATLEGFHKKTMGVALEAAWGFVQAPCKAISKVRRSHDFQEERNGLGFGSTNKVPPGCYGDVKRLRFVVVHGLKLVERPNLPPADSEWWYQENPAISCTDAVASEGGTTLDDWQRSIRNVRREIDIGGKTLQEVESAASRVRFGEVFSSFKEFEFSVDCWRAFICPSATRGILRYCEKVVALDACFTKNKKYPTQLFLASVVDGSSQIFPLAYAVAPVENYENWSWFVHNLHISIQGLRSEAVMIVSDRQKGLERAVTEVLPCNPHMHCGHHLKMNVQKLFGKTAVQVFQNLLHAKSEDR
ncbi:hypothetical protein R1sor_015242 [Riccia sorocarpa]|uniref:MULE transposase domain-containing protein n=1 Tax=Riccia sorocarpa TaxID=122646 RepID=A0ABD3HC14_9MARC